MLFHTLGFYDMKGISEYAIFSFRWASGALDPESSAPGDIVTSVKRFPFYFGRTILGFLYNLLLFCLEKKLNRDNFLQGCLGNDCRFSCLLLAASTSNVCLSFCCVFFS